VHFSDKKEKDAILAAQGPFHPRENLVGAHVWDGKPQKAPKQSGLQLSLAPGLHHPVSTMMMRSFLLLTFLAGLAKAFDTSLHNRHLNKGNNEPRTQPCDEVAKLQVIKNEDQFVPYPPCGTDIRLSTNGEISGSPPRECVYYTDLDEYECICEENNCKNFRDYAITRGFIADEEGLCAAKGYKLDKVRTWWWLCVPE